VSVDFMPDVAGSKGTTADMRAQIVYRATDGSTVHGAPVASGPATITLTKAPKNNVVVVVISNVTMSGYKTAMPYGWDPSETFGYKLQVTGPRERRVLLGSAKRAEVSRAPVKLSLASSSTDLPMVPSR
jgi:hypothetical protein